MVKFKVKTKVEVYVLVNLHLLRYVFSRKTINYSFFLF